MADVSKIKLPNGTTYNIKDENALPLTGGSVTGPVSFGDSVSIDEATVGDLVVNGSASFTNNIQANTINGVEVGSNPKFTDTNTVTTATTTGSGNAVTAVTASNGALTITKGTTFLTSHQDISGKANKATTLAGYGITNAYTKTEVDNLFDELPEPMIFKGSVGTGGTITSLPTATTDNEGWTYKVITALSSPAAKVGDTVISNGSSWVVIPSGDEPSGTVTSVAVSNGGGLSVSGSPITSSGTITISHADTSSQASSSNSGRTYIQSLTLDTYGHVTGISTATETVTNTDKKLQIAAVTSGNTYYPIVGTGTVAATREYDTTGFKYEAQTGTTSAVGNATLTLGNSKGIGVDTNKEGKIKIFGRTVHSHTIQGGEPTADRILTLPNATGVIALTNQIPTIPSSTGSKVTGITASTTATKTTLGTASSIYGVKSGTNSTTTASKASGSNGSASTWAFEEVSIPNVTDVGSASTWTFGSTIVGDGTLVGEIDSSDSSMLVITAGTKTIKHKTGGANGSAPTLGTAIKVQSKKIGSNGTAPSWSFTDVTVPIRNDSATSVPNVSVASATVSITDPGHIHSI